VKIGGRRPPPAPDAEVIRKLAGLLAETGLMAQAKSIALNRTS